ncbi:hypothetical protein HDU76_002131 [Blyttiomyces sp. JEL0837]|nr:hypothetical protein HDU76_002131 [Blyttiomyces sp. JEL0837]
MGGIVETEVEVPVRSGSVLDIESVVSDEEDHGLHAVVMDFSSCLDLERLFARAGMDKMLANCVFPHIVDAVAALEEGDGGHTWTGIAKLASTSSKQPAPTQQQQQQLLTGARKSAATLAEATPMLMAGQRSSSLVKTVFASTAIAEDAMERERESGQSKPPPLNLLTTTPYNLTRMVLRLGPVVNGKEVLEDLLSWKDPVKTIVAMFVYVTLCLYPTLLLILPQVGILAVIGANYYKRNEPRAHANPALVQESLMTDPSLLSQTSNFQRMQSAGTTAAANPTIPTMASSTTGTSSFTSTSTSSSSNINPPRSPTESSLMTTTTTTVSTTTNPQLSQLQPQTPSHVQYLKNLQFLQNFMGMYCDTYDNVSKLSTVLDWSDAKSTNTILRATLTAIPLAILAYLLVPAKTAFLILGLFFFLRHTVLWQLITSTIPRSVVLFFRRLLAALVKAIPLPDAMVDLGPKLVELEEDLGKKSEIVIVEVYENQRWWAGPGWTSHMLQGERSAWSDETGMSLQPPRSDDDAPPLPGWEWVAKSWTLDTEWSATDEKGWVYSDHNWQSPSPTAGLMSLTRRRRWYRSMRPCPGTSSASLASGSRTSTDSAASSRPSVVPMASTGGVPTPGGGMSTLFSSLSLRKSVASAVGGGSDVRESVASSFSSVGDGKRRVE